jgi:hypothetical protein
MNESVIGAQVFVHFVQGDEGVVVAHLGVADCEDEDLEDVLVSAAALLVDAANGVDGLGPVFGNRAERRRQDRHRRRRTR